MNRIERGLLAGAAATLALEVASYLDMTARGRAPSDLPSQAAGELAARAGVELGDDEQAKNRKGAFGALLGYATGTTIGGLCGVAVGERRIPLLKGSLVIGAIAMASADLPMTALRVTNPTKWGKQGWVSDAVPHAVYGLVFAQVWNSLARMARQP